MIPGRLSHLHEFMPVRCFAYVFVQEFHITNRDSPFGTKPIRRGMKPHYQSLTRMKSFRYHDNTPLTEQLV